MPQNLLKFFKSDSKISSKLQETIKILSRQGNPSVVPIFDILCDKHKYNQDHSSPDDIDRYEAF